jgi:hypothetical protein
VIILLNIFSRIPRNFARRLDVHLSGLEVTGKIDIHKNSGTGTNINSCKVMQFGNSIHPGDNLTV